MDKSNKGLRFSGIQRFTLLDYPEHISCIVFLPGCNFRCVYCHNPEFVLPELVCKMSNDFIPEEAILEFLKDRLGKLEGVVVSGGEPTIHAGLPAFLKKIQDLGLLTKLDTNGSHPEVVKKLLEENLLSYVALDVKTQFSDYKNLAGNRASGEKVSETLEVLKVVGVPFEVRCTLLPAFHTPEVLRVMGKALEGIENMFLQAFRSQKTLDPKLSTAETFSETELEKIADQYFRPYAKKVKIRT